MDFLRSHQKRSKKMDWITEPERKTPVVADVDLVICGGGFAGGAAAVGAARNGLKPLLLEKDGFLGGLCTAGLVITTPPLDNGINLEIARRLKEKRVYVPCRSPEREVVWQNLIAVDPEIVKHELVRMLQENGVDILFHTYIVGPLMAGKAIQGIVMENKAGRQAVKAKIVVDATGDADVAAMAGAPFRLGKKPMTLMFNMAGVDIPKALAHLENWDGLRAVVTEAVEKGELVYNLGLFPEFGAPGLHAEKLVHEGELNVWSGNLLGMNGVDPRDQTQAEIVTREHAMRLANFLKNKVPGFEKSRIEYTATYVGVRATRNIIGGASPTMDEVLKKRFADTIAKPYAQSEMRLPYGSLLPQNVENLLVAGRCMSADEAAMGQLRLIPVCSATGEAAGVAAALSLKQGVNPRYVKIPLLQKTLMEQGVSLAE
jgi:glycine/D-amino acid oxidase-like deaminating enzyme